LIPSADGIFAQHNHSRPTDLVIRCITVSLEYAFELSQEPLRTSGGWRVEFRRSLRARLVGKRCAATRGPQLAHSRAQICVGFSAGKRGRNNEKSRRQTNVDQRTACRFVTHEVRESDHLLGAQHDFFGTGRQAILGIVQRQAGGRWTE